MIKLIATDLDGTLLTDYRPNCSDEAIALMGALIRKGVYVMPASGRQLPNLERMFEKVDGDMMYLCENGALVTYQSRVLLKNYFPRDLALFLCHMVLDQTLCEVLISGERTSYVIPRNASYVDYLRNHIKNNVTVIERPEDITEDIMKVSFYTDEVHRDAITEDFVSQVGDRCQCMVSGLEWVDFAPNGTSKGDAMARLGQILGISVQDMAAFGDNENDRTMLELVGHPYLMEHCNPSMEDISAVRVRRVEDELKKILMELK